MIKFPNSRMDRYFLLTKLSNLNVYICTTHLESLNNAAERAMELHQIKNVLKEYEIDTNTILFMGDFNFDSERNFDNSMPLENRLLEQLFPDYDDINCGYTFDSTINTMILRYERMRYDRILCRSKRCHVMNAELVGNTKKNTNFNFFPSDHFGLGILLSINDPFKYK